MSTRERAIAIAEEHRAIHEGWRDYWREQPPATREDRELRQAVGGVRWHERCIGRYNVILRALGA